MEETRGLSSTSLWTLHRYWTPHATLLLIQQCVQNSTPQEAWAKSVSGACVVCEYVPRLYSPENIDVDPFYSEPQSRHTTSICKHKRLPPSHDDNGSIKDLETMVTPCLHKLANDQLDLGFSGWKNVLLALTSLPQSDCEGLAPQTLVPRPIVPNHCEWRLASSF